MYTLSTKMYCLENGMENMNLLKVTAPVTALYLIYESAPALKFQVYLVRP